MNLIRGLVLALTAALLTAAAAPADEPKKDEPKGRPPSPPSLEFQLPPGFQLSLLSREAVERLKLTDEQRKKYDKIEAEYKDKQKDANEKFLEVLKSGDVDKIREMAQDRIKDSFKMRTDYLDKVEGILMDEQKKAFEQFKKEPPRPEIPGPGFPPGFPGFPGRMPPSGPVLSKTAQDRLKLSDDQKKKIEELQKEVDSKLKDILTDEQKKQLEELIKEAGRPPEFPRPPSGRDR
jgi:Spy/CpxP family protein refolding chaperone